MKSKLLIWLFAGLSLLIIFNRWADWKNNVLTWDKCGYHLYLPAVFIYHDVDKLFWYLDIDDKYHPTADDVRQFMTWQPGGKLLDKYSCGVSCLELPFFLCAHLYTITVKDYPADGFSLPYQWGAVISSWFWVITGLFFLRSFLKRYFKDNIVAYVLACIAFGTNLYHYTVFDMCMSHTYSFMLYALLLWVTDRWYRKANIPDAFLLGIVLGFIFITRQVNIIAAIIPVLWLVYSFSSLKQRVVLLLKLYKHVIAAIAGFILIALVQASYWKYVTGNWLCYSYKGEGFNFLHPRFWPGLFSFRKGWFIYTPMAMLFVAGLYTLWKQKSKMLPSILIYTVIHVYVIFSWRCWWYGGGFGCRAIIESYPILSIALASLFERTAQTAKNYKKVLVAGIAMFFIALNIFQSYQYSLNIIHWDRMSRDYYIHSFGKIKYDNSIVHYLMTEKEWAEEDKRSHGY